MTKYIPSNNEAVIRTLIANCNKQFPEVMFKVFDTESLVIATNDVDKIIDAIDGGDEEIGINCYDREGNHLGWFGVLPYEAEDIIFDHSDNEFCDTVWSKMQIDKRQIDK